MAGPRRQAIRGRRRRFSLTPRAFAFRGLSLAPGPASAFRLLRPLAVGPGLNIGNAVMAGLVRPSTRRRDKFLAAPTSVSSEVYDGAAVFSGMAGTSQVKPGHDGEPESTPPIPNAIRACIHFTKIKKRAIVFFLTESSGLRTV
jgi:hypothetical protein